MKKIGWAAGFAAAIASAGLWACGGDDSNGKSGTTSTTQNDSGTTGATHTDSGATGTAVDAGAGTGVIGDAGIGLGAIGDANLDLDALFAAPTGTCVTLETCCNSLTGLEQLACTSVLDLTGDDQTVCSQALASFREGGLCK